MTLDVVFFAGETRLAFSAKPSAGIRGALKRNGYRWSPAGQFWHRRGVAGGADFADWLRAELDREAGIRSPDGPCWECGAADGFFRNEGAATPVRCDACADRIRADRARVDRFDLDFEDRCAAACGL
jgi:hypothetical protein